jgi:hypothetical protein
MATTLKDVESGVDKIMASNGMPHSASSNSPGGISAKGGGMKKSLSKAFLSSGMAVTFKVRCVTCNAIAHFPSKPTFSKISGCVVIHAHRQLISLQFFCRT